MKIIQFIVCFLLAMFLCGFGCSSPKPTPDPLAGWQYSHMESINSNKAVLEDCKNYIQTLSLEEKKFADVSGYFEDGTGQHAVQIEIPLNGTWWFHVLIYDKDNKRIKTIKYSPGKYAS